MISLVSLTVTVTHGQLCSGSLGDPVVNINFGTGTNPGPPLTTSRNYTYTTSVCPPDGSYSVVSSSNNCFGNSWHTLTSDHTPNDVNGYMMLVNASLTPGDFYVDTVRNLCGAGTYEFSAWIINVMRTSACNGGGTQPNITFRIETVTGTVLQTYNTDNIPASFIAEWRQYGFFFTLPSTVSSLVLRITNNAPGGCGNDLALDDIAFRPCGPKIDAVFSNTSAIGDTASICFTDNISITLSGSIQSGYNNPAYQWQQSADNGSSWTDIPGANLNSYSRTFNRPGTFKYRMAAAETGSINTPQCRVSSNVLSIIVDSFPIANAGSNSPVCVGANLNLHAQNGVSYLWAGPGNFSSTQQSPSIGATNPGSAGKYFVRVISAGGCGATDSTEVVISPLPAANAGADETICQGDKVVLGATGGQLFSWQPLNGISNPSINNPVASPFLTTAYILTVTNPGGCKDDDTVLVTVYKKPLAIAGPDKKINEGQAVQLEGGMDTTAGFSFYWSPTQFLSDATSLKPFVNPPNDINYTLTVTSPNGCSASSDAVFVRVFKKINIPNTFTPNGDGINDVWYIDGLQTYPESVTKVFNRYGQLVYRSNGYSRPWDGTLNGSPLPVGTYYYIIDRNSDLPVSTGSITIIR